MDSEDNAVDIPSIADENQPVDQENLSESVLTGTVAEGSDNVGSGENIASTKRRKSLKLALWGAVGVVSVVGIIVGGIAIFNGVEAAVAEREAVVESHADEYSSYLVAGKQYTTLTSELVEARSDLEATGVSKDDAAGEVFLAAFDRVLEQVSDLNKYLDYIVLPASATNEELSDEQGTLATYREKLEAGVQRLQDARAALDAAVEEREVAIQEAKAAAELQAKKDGAQPISYEELFRAGDSVVGTYYKFNGKIIQDAGSGQYRVSITADPGYSRTFWKDPIYVMIIGDPSQRLLEDDLISFTASSVGVMTYQSIFGQSIQVPSVMADASDVAVTGRDG